ncbi:hypothetical protein FJQ64_12510 [Lysinibacillus sp. BW-2-10]|nr:hypothetical protein FJQ64_12510 [Lysinibacillus sp. BW-2-10]
MMKKILLFFVTMLFVLATQNFALAAEDKPPLPYFGNGATVQDLGNGEYVVKTEGAKDEEGFVYTAPKPFTTEKIQVQVSLKGQGTVMLKISETTARGQFIREERLPIQLTEEWKTYSVPYELASTTSQIDVSIVTQSKEQVQYTFKDLVVKEQ